MQNLLSPGQAVPWFHGTALSGNPRYGFSTAGGRWILMLLMGSGRDAATQGALRLIAENRALFDDSQACFFGVSIDPQDAAQERIAQQLPGIRWFLDYDHAISAQFGAVETQDGRVRYTPHWLLLDPMLRVVRRAGLQDGPSIIDTLRSLTAAPLPDLNAPVLVVPGVFSPTLCAQLVDLYQREGGEESGFMREEDGMTVVKVDHRHKRRADHNIQDPALIGQLKTHMVQTLQPMIRRAFQFEASRVERFIIACYDARDGGHFRPHRDNSTKGTAHRRFACTINLNADDYEGGDLCFPEFGQRTYRAPTGGAVIFSCSLLHEARPVMRGQRYAFLPFFYDDAAARIREQNRAFLTPELAQYESGLPPGG
ncbi:MAG: 2OG-Fe(II) oxygenase [Sphingomonadaceae bacterium]|nr:2OG-Fe(II) oxygenase [Sphingomonadaceae bacterium]